MKISEEPSMNLIGVMWAKNEADIISETIDAAVRCVDSLLIADDGSTDNTWQIIQDKKRQHASIEHVQQKPNGIDRGQRQALLDVVRQRYNAADTWVQVVESDVFILDTDIRECLAGFNGMALSWQTLNAVRRPGTWASVDTYPHWERSIRELMPFAHRMEVMLYTFRQIGRAHL